MAGDPFEFDKFVGLEPTHLTGHFVEIREGTAYFQGSTARVLGLRYELSPMGLIVPIEVTNPITKYFGLYVTVSEYSDFFGTDWTREQAITGAKEISSQWPRIELVRMVSRIRRSVGDADEEAALLEQYCAFLGQDRATRLLNVLRNSEPKRAFLARQLITQTFSHVLRYSPDKVEPSLALETNSGILISHLIAESLAGHVPAGDIRVGTKEFDEFALHLLANQFFHNREDTLLSLARTRRLWKSTSPRARTELKGRVPEDIMRDALGTSVDVQIACGLSVIGAIREGADESYVPKIKHPIWGDELSRFLDRVSLPVATPHHELLPINSEWDMVEFVERPFIRVGASELVPVDVGLVEERISNGLFEEVKSQMKRLSISGDLNRAWGHVIEDYVNDRLAPPLEAAGIRALTEDDFVSCYKDVQTSRPDLILDFGHDVLVLEVMKGGMRANTALRQDVNQFQEDLERCLFKKVGQLSSVVKTIAENPQALIPDGRPRRFIPLVVSGDKFAHSFIVRAYVEHLNFQKQLFDQTVCDLPVLIDLGEIEILEALVEQGIGIDQVIRDWKASELHDVSLKNFIFGSFAGTKIEYRSTRLKSEFDASITEIFRLFEFENGGQ